MGYILRGKCKTCDFEKEFRFVGNKVITKLFVCYPLQITKLEFVELNYYDYLNSESKYLFFNDGKLKTNDLESNYRFKNYDVEINQRDNFCPKCKTYGLNFFLRYLTD